MPVIRSETPDQQLFELFGTHTVETLYAYAAFVGESPKYVLVQAVDIVLARDPDFLRWRAEHPGSFVPQVQKRRRLSGRPRRAHKASSGPATDDGIRQ